MNWETVVVTNSCMPILYFHTLIFMFMQIRVELYSCQLLPKRCLNVLAQATILSKD